MFHAFQHAFPAFHADAAGRDRSTTPLGVFNQPIDFEDFQWISEGTAAVAEDTEATLVRSHTELRDLHPIHRALTASDIETVEDHEDIAYRAQDFWVHVGLTKGLGLDYLKGLFRRGASPAAAAAFLAEEQQTTLGAEYWAWVKNQAIEKKIDFDGRLTDPCRIVVPRDDAVTGPVAVLAYPAAHSPPEVKGTLPRLSATVVRSSPPRMSIAPPSASAGPKKWRIRSTSMARTIALRSPTASARSSALSIVDVVYVLLANTQHERGSRLEYRCRPCRPRRRIHEPERFRTQVRDAKLQPMLPTPDRTCACLSFG